MLKSWMEKEGSALLVSFSVNSRSPIVETIISLITQKINRSLAVHRQKHKSSDIIPKKEVYRLALS
jgi:hypothetical protein